MSEYVWTPVPFSLVESVVFQNNRSISRAYTPPAGRGTILTAVPTHPPLSVSGGSGKSGKWDGNPDTFEHPMLRRCFGGNV